MQFHVMFQIPVVWEATATRTEAQRAGKGRNVPLVVDEQEEPVLT